MKEEVAPVGHLGLVQGYNDAFVFVLAKKPGNSLVERDSVLLLQLEGFGAEDRHVHLRQGLGTHFGVVGEKCGADGEITQQAVGAEGKGTLVRCDRELNRVHVPVLAAGRAERHRRVRGSADE